jgi:hypothetical protein
MRFQACVIEIRMMFKIAFSFSLFLWDLIGSFLLFW